MKVYILSDDSFFTLGLSSVLTAAGHQALVLDSTGQDISLAACHDTSGIVIIDINERERLNSLLHQGIPQKLRLVFVTHYHGGEEELQGYFNVFIPRKILCQRIIPWLSRYLRQEVRHYCQLSECEKIILYLLLNGESPASIAEKLSISVKTISKHKVSALNKLGIRKMNNKSLLFISDYIYKTVFLSTVYNNRAQHALQQANC